MADKKYFIDYRKVEDKNASEHMMTIECINTYVNMDSYPGIDVVLAMLGIHEVPQNKTPLDFITPKDSEDDE